MLIPLDELPEGFASTSQTLVNQGLVGWSVHDYRVSDDRPRSKVPDMLEGLPLHSPRGRADCSGWMTAMGLGHRTAVAGLGHRTAAGVLGAGRARVSVSGSVQIGSRTAGRRLSQTM